MTLTIAAPQFAADPPGSMPVIEKPVALRLHPLRYADGGTVAASEAQTVGVFVYRSGGGGEEIWNEQEKRWQPPPSALADLAAFTPVPLAAKAGDPQPWQGVLVAAGQKDVQGAARFTKAVNGTPRYRLRAYAKVRRDGVEHAGLSAPSADWTFANAADDQRFTIGFDTETARDAQRVRIQLRNGALVSAGFVEIRASGPEVEIANCDAGGAVLARVLLAANGDIRLEPKAGQAIVLGGVLEAQEIRYQPHNQPGRQTL